MSWLLRACVVGGGLLAGGYLWGRLDATVRHTAFAQEPEAGPSEETAKKIQAANEALKGAVEALKNESRYTVATKSINVYGVMTGGLNAMDDLESGRGVDPETFAALYAGEANDEVAQHLSKDEEGRLTYKNRVIRIYPVSRLKKLSAQRLVLTGEAQLPSAGQ
jgi:hypothetical protein